MRFCLISFDFSFDFIFIRFFVSSFVQFTGKKNSCVVVPFLPFSVSICVTMIW